MTRSAQTTQQQQRQQKQQRRRQRRRCKLTRLLLLALAPARAGKRLQRRPREGRCSLREIGCGWRERGVGACMGLQHAHLLRSL